MTDGSGWRTLREIDEAHGAVKGTAFLAFKRIEHGLTEGRDYRVLLAPADVPRIEQPRTAGRIYLSSRNVLMLSPSLSQSLLERAIKV